MGGSGFDTILQEVQRQQVRLEQVQNENRELHQQLSDLRAGKGIFLEINGLSIPLKTQMEATPSDSSHTTSTSAPTKRIVSTQEVEIPGAQSQKTSPETTTQEQREEQHAPAPIVEQVDNGKEKVPQPTFLEEIMLQEIESTLTAPIPTAQRAVDERNTPSTEENKDDLRRALKGSYILE